jgi:hypothetical protein
MNLGLEFKTTLSLSFSLGSFPSLFLSILRFVAPIHNFLYGTAALVVDDATESETQEEESSLMLKGVLNKRKARLDMASRVSTEDLKA